MSQQRRSKSEPRVAEQRAGSSRSARRDRPARRSYWAALRKARPADRRQIARYFLGSRGVAAGVSGRGGLPSPPGAGGLVPVHRGSSGTSNVSVLMLGFATRCGSCRSSSPSGMSIWISGYRSSLSSRGPPKKRCGTPPRAPMISATIRTGQHRGDRAPNRSDTVVMTGAVPAGRWRPIEVFLGRPRRR